MAPRPHLSGQFDGQGELFSGASYERTKHPSEMLQDDWIAHHGGAVTYHGTFREDWKDSPVLHTGTVGQASYRLDQVARGIKNSPTLRAGYYSGERVGEDDEFEEDPEGATHTGRVHAMRMTGTPYKTVLRDSEVNSAHYLYLREQGHEDWEVPGSVLDSMDPEVRSSNQYGYEGDVNYDETAFGDQHVQALQKGQPLEYRNAVEANQGIDPSDTLPHSFAIPRSGHTTWERDVVGKNSRASDMAKSFAQQRIQKRTEGMVTFPSAAVHSEGWQDSLFGGRAGHPYGGEGKRRTLSDIQFTTKPEE